ncbi:MAG: glycosyltransferase family 39 protein [Anaerolineales bacterium]|jgi:4-amino-4-deoxy-L-arabinose transferase-like glycosyltransferase
MAEDRKLRSSTRRAVILTIAWMFLLGVITLLLNLPWSPDYRPLVNDSGVYAYVGSAITHGQLPYRDAWEQKPPIGFYLDALAVLLLGQNPWAIWWLNLIWIVLSAIACFLILKKMFGLPAGMIASLVFVLAVMNPEIFQGGNLMEIYGLLPQVIIIGAAYAFFLTRRDRWIFFAGLLTGLAFMTKQTTIALGAASLLTILVVTFLGREWKALWVRVVTFTAGFVIPVGIAVVYWLAAGAFSPFFEAVFSNGITYVGEGAPFLWSIKHTFLSVFPGMFISKLYYVSAIAFLVYLIDNYKCFLEQVSSLRLKNTRSGDFGSPVEWTMLAVFIALPIEIVFASLGGRNFGHYFLTLIPAVTTGIGYIFWKAILFLRHAQFRPIIFHALPGLIGILLGLASLVWMISALTGEVPTRAQLTSFPDIFSRRFEMGDLLNYILTTTGPDDRVLVWHIHLEINFITDRRPPQRILFPAQLFIPTGGPESRLAEFLDEMDANPPELIIVQQSSSIGLPFVNVPIDHMCPKGACIPEMAAALKLPNTAIELQKLRDYFLAHYSLDKQMDGWLIYRHDP